MKLEKISSQITKCSIICSEVDKETKLSVTGKEDIGFGVTRTYCGAKDKSSSDKN